MDRLRARGRKAWLHWRGDQLSALALDRLRSSHEADVVGLFVYFGPDSMPGAVHLGLRTLIEEQAASLELPLQGLEAETEAELDTALWERIEVAKPSDLRALAFPWVHRASDHERSSRWASRTQLDALFPLLGSAPSVLSSELLSRGFRSVVNHIDPARVPPHLLGRTYSAPLLEELSPELDPLGQDGAFDTFVCGGPGLIRPISPRLVDMIEAPGGRRAVLGPGPRRAYGDV